MRKEPRKTLQPGFYLRMRVRAVIVHYQMQRCGSRTLLIKAAKKSYELLMPMPFKALTNNTTLQHF